VSAVNEKEFRWAVFSVIRGLFLADGSEIPDVNSTVGASRGKVDGRVWRPSDLKNVIGVRLERMKFEREFSDIPKRNSLKSTR